MADSGNSPVTERPPRFIWGRTSVGCWCLQMRRGSYRYQILWPPIRFTRLWRKVTG